MCWVCKIKQIIKIVGEVQTENKDEAIGEDQARRESGHGASRPQVNQCSSTVLPGLPLKMNCDLVAKRKDSVYQQPGGRRSMDGDGMVGMLKWI